MEASDKAAETAGEATAAAERPSSGRLVERDVEAPEVFQATDKGLWDGRPSLGGVWVAYPDVTGPERVIIRNDSNGKFVIGALFKRERENPGPKLQVSSDAAAALGMLAGSPTTLNVTALRREEPKLEKAAEAVASADADTAKTIDTAAAAIDRADAAAATDTADIADASAETATTKKSGWNPFRKKSVAEPETAAAATEEVVGTEVATAKPAKDAVITPNSSGAVMVASEALEVTDAEPAQKKQGWNPFRRKQTETVTAVAATGSAALATGDVTTQTLDGAQRVASEAAAAPEASGTAKSSKLDKPYIQIGIFSQEENATDTAKELRKNGIVPQVYQQQSSGKTFWRVVAGPANSKVDQGDLLKKVKDMGFADAYPVRG